MRELNVKWPCQFSNTAAMLVLNLATARAWVLVCKLRFLKKCLREDCVSDGGAVVLRSLFSQFS